MVPQMELRNIYKEMTVRLMTTLLLLPMPLDKYFSQLECAWVE